MPMAATPNSFPSILRSRRSLIGQSRQAVNKARFVGVRRRGTMLQGRALENLGHAVEYLIDSRMFSCQEYEAAAHAEAIQILKCASRAVFNDCAEVVPMHLRLTRWLSADLWD